MPRKSDSDPQASLETVFLCIKDLREVLSARAFIPHRPDEATVDGYTATDEDEGALLFANQLFTISVWQYRAMIGDFLTSGMVMDGLQDAYRQGIEELERLLEQIPPDSSSPILFDGRRWKREQLLKRLEKAKAITPDDLLRYYEKRKRQDAEWTETYADRQTLDRLTETASRHFEQRLPEAMRSALYALMCESACLAVKQHVEESGVAYRLPDHWQEELFAAPQQTERLKALFDIKPGHRNADRWFCCPKHFNIAVKEELQRLDKKPTLVALARLLDTHRLRTPKTKQTDKPPDKKTLLNWLQKIDCQNLNEAWAKFGPQT